MDRRPSYLVVTCLSLGLAAALGPAHAEDLPRPAHAAAEAATAPAARDVAPPHVAATPVPQRSSATGTPDLQATAVAKPHPPIPEPVKVSDDPTPTLGPRTFNLTLDAADRYRQIVDAGGWPSVPNAITLVKPGERNPAVPILRRRLEITGDLVAAPASDDIFDEPLAAAARRFQARNGLPEAGIIGPRTLAALNVPAATRLLALQRSAARLMGSRFPFGERYVAVNIPSATVEAVKGGIVARRYVAVVGKPDRASPTLEARITSINLNPTWTVPVSLIRKDIIPHMRKDPGFLAKEKIRILDGQGAEIDPATIDWSTERAVNYTLRQDPGEGNSLGEIRIDMPNRLAVYMHDTPSKRLFARNVRLNSSGCVRVSGVRDLAAWLMEGTAGPAGSASWGEPEIEAAIKTEKRQDVKLVKPVPVDWVYLTGYATRDGTVHFRDDVYGLDTPAADPASAAPDQKPLTLDALVTSSLAEKL